MATGIRTKVVFVERDSCVDDLGLLEGAQEGKKDLMRKNYCERRVKA